MADKKITRQLSIFINNKEIKNSLGGIGREIAKVKKQLKEANDPKDIKKYKGELDKLGEKYGEVNKEIHGTNDVLEEAGGHWSNLMSGFLSGNIKQATAGLKGLAGNIKNITKAAWAFIATPIGAAIATVAAVGLGVKKWVKYNLEIEKTNQLVRDLTQESGNAVSVIRIRAEALNKFFEVDINKSVESAKSLVKSYGISYNEAFDIIEDGAVRGKLKNDEFLDSLKEYPIQFKNAGFSAQDFANIVSTGIDLSIYSDKLPDAIKEFNLAITEQTDAAKEALTNAFGEKFTTKLLKGVENGSISAKDALATISAEAERIGLNSQQAQLLTADLFKGAGEDAGGALKVFEAVNIALNEQKKPLTEIQQIQKDQLETNKELNSVYTQLFASGSKGFNIWIQKGKLFATQTLIKILKGGVDVYNWFVDMNNESSTFSAILKHVGISATTGFTVVGEVLGLAWKQVTALGSVVQGIFTLNPRKIQEGLAIGFTNITNTLNTLKVKAISDALEVYDAYNGNNKLEKISLDDLLSDDTGAVVNDEDDVVVDDGTADELTPEDKRIIDSKKRLKELLKENKLEEEAQRLEEGVLAAETLEEKTNLEFERLKWIALQELQIQKDKELESLKSKNATAEELKAVEDKYRLKKDGLTKKLDKEKAKAEAKLKKDKIASDAQDLKDQELLTKQRTQAYSTMFGNIAQLLGAHTAAGKAAAIAQATINTYQGVTEVWKTESVLPEPFATIAKVASTGVVLASGLKSVGFIKGTKTGFYDGGPTGDKAMYNDEYGAVTGVVHDKEWVAPKFMTESPRYAPTINWLETQRKKELGQYFDGGNTSSTSSNDEVLDEIETDNESINLTTEIYRLNNLLSEGIKTGAILIGDEQIELLNDRIELLAETHEAAKII